MKALLPIVLSAWIMPAVAQTQEWTAYTYPDAGFGVQFPAAPSVEKSSIKTNAGATLPLTRYVLKQDRIIYSVSVVDYTMTNADAGTIAESEKSFGTSGKVTVAIDARINRSFGRELSVLGNDGSRSAVAIFFVNKHLFTLVGQALPPKAIEKSGDAIRFQESLTFIGANGGFGAGGFGGPGAGRFRGGFNPQAQTACSGKAAGDAVQLQTPGGLVAATCTLIARPNQPPGGPGGGPAPN